MRHKRIFENKGFTLGEITVVIFIIGCMAAFAIPNLLSQREIMRAQEARLKLLTIFEAQKTYFRENGSYLAGTDTSNLEIVPSDSLANRFKTLTLYKATTVSCGTTNINRLASLIEVSGKYTLNVTTEGGVCCTPCDSDICVRINANMRGC